MRVWKPFVVLSLSAAVAFAQEKPAELMTTGPATRPVIAPTTQPKQLVYVERGELPIILSAPHGGRMAVPGSGPRTGKNVLIKKGSKNTFTMAFDGNVDLIALKLADEIEQRTGKRPYVVVANFSRRFVDANRPPEQAYEDDAGQTVYEQYHDAIAMFRREIIKNNKRGLILDIHGHGRDKDAIIRGTANWTSVKHLVEEFGKDSVTGPDGLLGPLAAAGKTFVPPVDKPDEPEYEALNGGYITRHYGSYAGGDFDAVQLELGATYRKAENVPQFSSLLADGVVQFMDKYLLAKAPTTQAAAR